MNADAITLKARTDDYRLAQRRLDYARDTLAEEVRDAIEAGMSQSEAARIVGVDRLTIRKWLSA